MDTHDLFLSDGILASRPILLEVDADVYLLLCADKIDLETILPLTAK